MLLSFTARPCLKIIKIVYNKQCVIKELTIMNKPTLVLIPGLLCDNFVWHNQIPILEKHANIIIPDVNHFNNTNDLIKNIIAISPPKFYLAGHSMGGVIAIELMRNYSSHV